MLNKRLSKEVIHQLTLKILDNYKFYYEDVEDLTLQYLQKYEEVYALIEKEQPELSKSKTS